MTTNTREKVKFDQDGDGNLTPLARLVATEIAFPEQWYLATGAISATNVASGTAVYTSTDISAYSQFVLEIAAITGTSPVLNAAPSFDGTNYAATYLGWINLQTGAIISGATGITAAGIYALMGHVGGGLKMKNLKLLLTGGAADLDITARGGHGVI